MNSTKKKMKTGWLNVRAVYLALLFLAYSAKPALASDFAGEGAPTLGAGRVEVGVFSAAKWGVTDRVELGAHPVAVIVHGVATNPDVHTAVSEVANDVPMTNAK